MGRYAHDEREQRWLMRAVPAAAVRVGEIHDRCIAGTTMRLRRVVATDDPSTAVYKLGQKVRVVDGDPEVVRLTNMYVSAAEYGVLSQLPGFELRKTRFRVFVGDRTFAVDELHDRWRGLVLAETELAADEPLLDIVELVGVPLVREVTHDIRFSGGALATASEAEVAALLAEAARW